MFILNIISKQKFRRGVHTSGHPPLEFISIKSLSKPETFEPIDMETYLTVVPCTPSRDMHPLRLGSIHSTVTRPALRNL